MSRRTAHKYKLKKKTGERAKPVQYLKWWHVRATRVKRYRPCYLGAGSHQTRTFLLHFRCCMRCYSPLLFLEHGQYADAILLIRFIFVHQGIENIDGILYCVTCSFFLLGFSYIPMYIKECW